MVDRSCNVSFKGQRGLMSVHTTSTVSAVGELMPVDVSVGVHCVNTAQNSVTKCLTKELCMQ
jgi:hypothetical protein